MGSYHQVSFTSFEGGIFIGFHGFSVGVRHWDDARHAIEQGQKNNVFVAM